MQFKFCADFNQVLLFGAYRSWSRNERTGGPGLYIAKQSVTLW